MCGSTESSTSRSAHRSTGDLRDATVRTTHIDVRYAETDQMGVVHHANYLVWFELARTNLCRETGWHYAEIEEKGYLLVVTRTECRYLSAAHYGDTVAVTCWVERLGSRGVRFAYEVRRTPHGATEDPDAAPIAGGATEHIWVDRESRRPARLDADVQAAFRRMAGRA